MRYHNYHKHDHYGNPWATDVVVKPEDYCKRAVELGHTTVFTTNHGVQGNIFDYLECSKKYGLKMCYGTEAYYVENRFEKDRSNRHIVIVAKNNEGVLQLNDIMAEAHMTGFYYKPRIDKELLFSLNPKNFVVTSACVAGLWNNPELLLSLHKYFGKNFFLEMQSHVTEFQREVNSKMLELANAANIPIIHANDSHYILPSDSKYRDIFLKGKEQFYEEEDGMILDYPDSDTIFARYKKQGILSEKQVQEALENTLIFDDCSEITLINDDIKLPSVSDNPNAALKKIINERWKEERKDIPKEKHKDYLDAIRYEMDIIERTHMENYFLIDYYVVKDGQEKYGGMLTNTGRGSAPSFYTVKLLGLTDIDRIASPITLFPTRFMSVERILGARSLPDIDLNTADREPFIKATEDLLGKENCAWMISWKPLQAASAFRLYCKGIGLDISEYDDVAKDLDSYRNSARWKKIIEESQRFVGVVESISESPCSMLLYDKPVRRELGMVRTPGGKICCLLDGYNCDKYKYLKNDYLTVTVWAIIRDVCKLAGIKVPTIREFNKLLDDKTFDIYAKGLTSTINQADSPSATEFVKIYQPKSVSEMSGFVAIIRPGCASLLDDFIHRLPYTTGVEELDEILIDGNHRMIYQELIMKYLIWLGIPETGSYDIIKKIAKKKFKEAELAELKEKLLKGWRERVGKDDGFIETWTIVEQAAKYSFNASHSLSYAYDSLYGAYLKAHYPLEYYTVAFRYYSDDRKRTPRLTSELSSFGILLKPIKFRYSTGDYSISREDNSIYKGIQSIKYLNAQVADEMYRMRNRKFKNFMELLIALKRETTLDSRQIKILIELDFFVEFGNANLLLRTYDLYDYFVNGKEYKKRVQKAFLEKYNIPFFVAESNSKKETNTYYTDMNMDGFLIEASKYLTAHKRKISEKVMSQVTHLGYCDILGDEYAGMGAVIDIDTKYTPRLTVYSMKNGDNLTCKISKQDFRKEPLEIGSTVRIISTKYKPKMRKNDDGEWEPSTTEVELWITKYKKVAI